VTLVIAATSAGPTRATLFERPGRRSRSGRALVPERRLPGARRRRPRLPGADGAAPSSPASDRRPVSGRTARTTNWRGGSTLRASSARSRSGGCADQRPRGDRLGDDLGPADRCECSRRAGRRRHRAVIAAGTGSARPGAVGRTRSPAVGDRGRARLFRAAHRGRDRAAPLPRPALSTVSWERCVGRGLVTSTTSCSSIVAPGPSRGSRGDGDGDPAAAISTGPAPGAARCAPNGCPVRRPVRPSRNLALK